jgi:hypothetical protein
VKRFFKVDIGAAGWGLLANEGSAEELRFRVVLRGSERWVEQTAAEMVRAGV